MRGHAAPGLSVEVLARALADEFPELDRERLRGAVERAVARAASAALDTEGYRVVNLHLARAEATEERTERAQILRELADTLAQRGDADRALVVQLAAFAEAPLAADLEPLLRLARLTERWVELPLDTMSALVDINDDDSPRRLTELATAWRQVGRIYNAADCLERVLVIAPADPHANEALELIYRSTGEWPVLIDLLGRRAVHVVGDLERAELFREIGLIHERELDDASGALDAYQEADRLAPGHADVLEAIARLAVRVGLPEEELLATLERLGSVTIEPGPRARALCRAAELARNHDWDKAQDLFERARRDDPDLAQAVDGLVALLRDRGELGAAIALLVGAAARSALSGERARWLADAADLRVATGDFDEAKQLYREARAADPADHRAGVALVELCWDTGSLVELAPILDELCRTTDDPERLRHYLIQRSKVAVELGEGTQARNTLARAVDLDPGDAGARRELADLLFENREWARARPLIEELLDDDEDSLPPEVAIELHYRLARCAHETGDDAAAANHAAITLALAPGHRPALLLRAELDTADPHALLADQLALANSAPVDERASRFAALGDRYGELGDRATAREMYREALSYKPTDHLLLTKSLGLVADEGDWSYSLDLLQRLIDTEHDARVRARYRHTAAMIARDELGDDDRAVVLLDQAIEDDPLAFTAADELEAALAVAPDPDPLARFYYRRLDHVRNHEGRTGERLRLWDKLGELSLRLARREDAVVAFEVALSLAPDDDERRQRLADLYLEADPRHDADAIVQHHAVLRANKRRVASYQALRTLYARAGQPDKARACDDALAMLGSHVIEDDIHALFGDAAPAAAPAEPRPPARPLANEDWLALARIDVDLNLSGLFALVAPAFAGERARIRAPQAAPAREHEPPRSFTRVLGQVAAAFAMPRPAIFLDRDQVAPVKVAMRVRDGVLVPVLVVGPSLDAALAGAAGRPSGADLRSGDRAERELAFVLARQLADLRSDRIARLLCPRAGELAQIVELATALAPAGDGGADAASHAARWLTGTLHPLELDQTRAIGARLRERGIHPMSAALGWLAATERAADRIGFVVVGDLELCVRVLEREPAVSTSDLNRVLDLVWASVTEELLAVRARVDGWAGAPAARTTATLAAQPQDRS